VAYLSSNSNEYYIGENAWNSKKWRSLYIVDPENIMCAVKGYPYQHKELDNIVLDWLIELASENIDKDNNFTKYKFIPENEDSCGFVSVNSDLDVELAMECNYMYNDFGTIDYHCCALSEKFVKNYKELKESDSLVKYYTIYYSGPTECMCCGEETEWFNGENSLVCENCDNRIRCHHCGDFVYKEDTYEVDGESFCQYCYDNYVHICPFTNKLMYYHDSINIKIFKDPEENLKDEELENYLFGNREWNDFEINPEFFDSDEYSKYFKSPMKTMRTFFTIQYFLFESDLTEEAKNLLHEEVGIEFFCDRK
jgi:hypothetical protein